MSIFVISSFVVAISIGILLLLMCYIDDIKEIDDIEELRNGAPQDHEREDLAYGKDWTSLCRGCGKYYHHNFLDMKFQTWILDDGSSTTGRCVGRQCKECQKNHIGDPETVHTSDYFDEYGNMILPGEVMAYRSSR